MSIHPLKFLVFFYVFFSITVFPQEQIKILHIHSYSSDWVWIQDQYRGFLQGLGDINSSVVTIDLDAKNKQPFEVDSLVEKAHSIIASWKPDLVYTTDDIAQSKITEKYIGSDIPFLYSGVNMDPAEYGFTGANNITGVLEREHFPATIKFLQEIIKKEKLTLAIIIDDDPTWVGVTNRIKNELLINKNIQVLFWIKPATFKEFKENLLLIQDKVDAVGMLGVFRFLGDDGQYVKYDEVLEWTVNNSKLPDFSFWDTRVERGTLCAVTVSGVEQGKIAGEMARKILLQKISPKNIPPQSTTRGIPLISLARSKDLGIQLHTNILLNSKVLKNYSWNNN